MTARFLLPSAVLLSLCLPLACSDHPQPKPPAAGNKVTPPGPQGPSTPGPVDPSAPLPAGHPPFEGAAPPPAASGVSPESFRTSTATDDASFLEVGGIKAPKPASWTWQQPTMQFRALQYAVPASGESTAAAELIVSLFVDNDGGPTDANVDRWVNQFRTPDGKPIEAKRSTKEVDGLKILLLELEGTYSGMSGPGPRPDFKQFAAIVEGPRRRVFIRLLGPAKTVDANREAWTALIEGIRDTAKPSK